MLQKLALRPRAIMRSWLGFPGHNKWRQVAPSRDVNSGYVIFSNSCSDRSNSWFWSVALYSPLFALCWYSRRRRRENDTQPFVSPAMEGVWQPDEASLAQILTILRDSHNPDTAVQRSVQQVKLMPSGTCVCVCVLVYRTDFEFVCQATF